MEVDDAGEQESLKQSEQGSMTEHVSNDVLILREQHKHLALLNQADTPGKERGHLLSMLGYLVM